MARDGIGLAEAVSMAIGGMVGGGIFAVLGVVAGAAGTLAWAAFTVSGVVALCAGYSFVRLNGLTDAGSGPIAYVERFTGSTKLGGMTGWTFVVGYVGTMALYAHAFGGYFVELLGRSAAAGVPLRPVVTLAVVAVFVGLNLAGAHATGRTEDVLVGLKVLILLVFGVGGLYYGYTTGQLTAGLANVGVGPLLASAIAFVAFEGWELLFFDQGSIADPERTVKRAVYVSIVAATALYVVVAVVTTNLLDPSTIQQNAETSLALAARPFLGSAGFLLVSVAALFSTASALNATLFSAARLSRDLVDEDFLPSELTSDDGDEPVRPILVLGALTGALSVLGSLDVISSFASLAFVVLFGSVCVLAFTQRSSVVTAAVPALGALGATATVVALLYHLAAAEPDALVVVLALAVVVVGVELLYFERTTVVSEVRTIQRRL